MESRCELAEAAAFADMWAGLGQPCLRIAGATCIAMPAAPEHTPLNRTIGLGSSGPVGDDVLDEVEDFFRTAGVRRHAISVAPSADPGLGPRLAERGYSAGYPWMRFRRGIEPAPEVVTGLRVVDTQDGDTFGRIVAAGFELPPEAGRGFGALAGALGWHLLLAFAGEEPAGAAALFARDGVGWLGAAATLPEHRGKGAQTALLAARIRRGAELGLDVLTVETGKSVPDRPDQSYRNILRAGFSEWYLRPNLISPE